MQDTSPSVAFEPGEKAKNYVSNVSIEFTEKTATNIEHRIGALLARLKTFDSALQIRPNRGHEHMNPITDGKNIPSDHIEFEKFFTVVSSPGARASIKLYANIDSKFKIGQIKNHRPIFEYLQQHRI